MTTAFNVSNAQLCPGAADELIGYLYLLIEELQQKYCSEVLDKWIDEFDRATTKEKQLLLDIPDPF